MILIKEMPKKRRNGGRSKKNRGHTKPVSCTHCGRQVPKDKAVKRYTVRNMVDASSLRDIKDHRAFENFSIPKLYTKLQYCISCGIHLRVVRVRNVEVRRTRAPPPRVFRKEEEPKATTS
jgi:small subunit ribosomal protein S26e